MVLVHSSVFLVHCRRTRNQEPCTSTRTHEHGTLNRLTRHGRLTDDVIELALRARAKVCVLPCCHSTHKCDRGGLDGWIDAALAIDVTRAARLRSAGYIVYTQTIPAAITPKNRLLLAEPE